MFLDTNPQEFGRSVFVAYLVGVLWGAAVQSVKDELPGLNFDLPFASKHLGFGDTNLNLLTGDFLVSLLVTSSNV